MKLKTPSSQIRFWISLFLSLSAFSTAYATPGLNSDGSLDKEVVRKLYFEGEFPAVIEALESYRRNPGPRDREDSIFVFKYLSVVYAAEPSGRARAESFMYQLIKLAPTIELLDLYISDNIESIFRNVKAEYARREAYLQTYDRFGNPLPRNAGDKPATEPASLGNSGSRQSSPAQGRRSEERMGSDQRSSGWLWWLAGGMGIAGATTAYILLASADDPGQNVSPESQNVPIELHTPPAGK